MKPPVRIAVLLFAAILPLTAAGPTLHSVQILGGSNVERVRALATTPDGDLIVLGDTSSPDFPANIDLGTPGIQDGSPTPFLARIRLSDWSLTWAARLQGIKPIAMTLDPAGNIYLAGDSLVLKLAPDSPKILYTANLGIVTLSALTVNDQGEVFAAGQGDGPFFARLSADGAKILRATPLPPKFAPTAIALDPAQNVILAGANLVTKFAPDADTPLFLNLIGNEANATHLALRPNGDICITGTSRSRLPDNPNANGFLNCLSPDGAEIRFTTRLPMDSSSLPAALSVQDNKLLVPIHTRLPITFPGLSFATNAVLPSTILAVFNPDEPETSTQFQLPGIPANAWTLSGSTFITGSEFSQINRPVPSSIQPIGRPASNSAITLARFTLDAPENTQIELNSGYLTFDTLPNQTKVDRSVRITTNGEPVPYQAFLPLPECCLPRSAFSQSTNEGVTPATHTVSASEYPGYTGGGALLIVAPNASPSLQMLGLLVRPVTTNLSVKAPANIYLPAEGGTTTVDIQIAGIGTTLAGETIPVEMPVTLSESSRPNYLTLSQTQATTPATVKVTAQVDDLKPGEVRTNLISISSIQTTVRLPFAIYRNSPPAPPPTVSPTFLPFQGFLGVPSPAVTTVQINAPEGAPFQVESVSPRLEVEPRSGTGSAKLTVHPIFTNFPEGSTNETFTIRVNGTPYTVTVGVRIVRLQMGVNISNGISPGLRAEVNLFAVLPNLPEGPNVPERSPAPTAWNGYTFRYRTRTLPILAVDRENLIFTVQFPYDLDGRGTGDNVEFLDPTGKLLATAETRRPESPVTLAAFGPNPITSESGIPNTAATPARPGERITLSLVGTGATVPAIPAGELPPPGTAVVPTNPISVVIGGKPATLLRQALSTTRIGVTEVEVVVPILATGLQMVGVSSATSTLEKVPLWVVE